MNLTSPQILYMVFVLPPLFGLVLIGDGINKILHEEEGGIISIVFGIAFILFIVVAYFFFPTYLNRGA